MYTRRQNEMNASTQGQSGRQTQGRDTERHRRERGGAREVEMIEIEIETEKIVE